MCAVKSLGENLKSLGYFFSLNCSSQYFLLSPLSPDNCGILTVLWGCLTLTAGAKLPTCKVVSQGCSQELFGEQAAGVMEKAVYKPQTLFVKYVAVHFKAILRLAERRALLLLPTFIMISALILI